MTTILLQMLPVLEMTDEQFFNFCQLNSDYHLERSARGELLIMPPTGSESGNRNFNLIVQLGIWLEQDGTGIGFDSSTGFKLPNGSHRSPDVAWINLERWHQLTLEEQTRFAPICPDFVVEIASPSDSIILLKDKMQEYLENGASLGWLIDRQNRLVYIYRSGFAEVECLDNPDTVSGEPLLSQFNLKMQKIW